MLETPKELSFRPEGPTFRDSFLQEPSQRRAQIEKLRQALAALSVLIPTIQCQLLIFHFSLIAEL